MDWAHPRILLLFPLCLAFLVWCHKRSIHPMPQRRRRALLLVRTIVVALLLLALAGPAIERRSKAQAVVFVTDHSESLGTTGRQASLATMSRLVQTLPSDTQIGHVSTGEHASTQHLPSRERSPFTIAPEL